MIQMWPYTADELAFFTQGAGVLCNQKQPKETKMNYFNIDTITSEYAKNVKTFLGFVPSKEAKSLLEKIVDLQVEATKLVAETVTDSFKKIATAGK
jgi:hypothetical protein